MTEVDAAEHSVAGILAWYSTIHMPPPELKRALAVFRQLLTPSGVLVVGFFDSDSDVSEFDHKVTTATAGPWMSLRSTWQRRVLESCSACSTRLPSDRTGSSRPSPHVRREPPGSRRRMNLVGVRPRPSR